MSSPSSDRLPKRRCATAVDPAAQEWRRSAARKRRSVIRTLVSSRFRRDNQNILRGDLHAHASTKPARSAHRCSSLAASGNAAAAQFSERLFFGDSLTDAGSYKPVLPPGTGLFTTNPGPVWRRYSGELHGFTVTPANQGGTDYAQSAARHEHCRAFRRRAPTGHARVPIATQVYAIPGVRARRIRKRSTRSGAARTTSSFSWASRSDSRSDAGTGCKLASESRRAVSWRRWSRALHAGRRAVHHGLQRARTSARRRSAWAPGKARRSPRLVVLQHHAVRRARCHAASRRCASNAFACLNEVLANPAAYGFANATTPACGRHPRWSARRRTSSRRSAAQTFLFADGVHPTTAGHAAHRAGWCNR
mgnify:CR=1 FL=1